MAKLNAYFGEFGGQFVPQILVPALDQLEQAFIDAQQDDAFRAEFMSLLQEYAGRPTALTLTQNITKGTKTKLYLKREDLLHGGAHKPPSLAKPCSPNVWANMKLSPRQAQVNTVSQPH